jgi:hypothetical protein
MGMISQELIEKTFEYFDKHSSNKAIVSPSLPILYFGDLEAYEHSKLKVVTVGKNPSDNEFRLNKNQDFSFVRFSKWNTNRRNLTESLNPYFKKRPLKQWFSSFEPILNGLSASYYKGAENIAIHTDICSPLATNPTWSKLPKSTHEELYNEGFQIWKALIEELQPDVMLVSIPRALFISVFKSKPIELIRFKKKKDGENRKQPYVVEQYDYELKSKKKVKVIFGQAANKPFDTIHDQQKFEIGSLCLVKILSNT